MQAAPRPIKFRAWYKQESKMYEVVGTYFNLVILTPSQNTIGGIEIDKLELMQFTGLKDKNGREIWEGDIVCINHPADMTGDFTNAIGEVFWWDEEGAWYHTNNHDRPPKRMWQYVVVIGNIYENPELLKEQS